VRTLGQLQAHAADGRDEKLFTWTDEITADCLRKRARSDSDSYGAICPDLVMAPPRSLIKINVRSLFRGYARVRSEGGKLCSPVLVKLFAVSA
jgi:hypothetical protein